MKMLPRLARPALGAMLALSLASAWAYIEQVDGNGTCLYVTLDNVSFSYTGDFVANSSPREFKVRYDVAVSAVFSYACPWDASAYGAAGVKITSGSPNNIIGGAVEDAFYRSEWYPGFDWEVSGTAQVESQFVWPGTAWWVNAYPVVGLETDVWSGWGRLAYEGQYPDLIYGL